MRTPINKRTKRAPKSSPYLLGFTKSAVGIVCGFGLGFLIIRWMGVSREELFASLASAHPLRIFLGVLGGFALICSQALRWRAVLNGVASVRFATVFQSKLVGYAANSVLPARLGDFVRMEFVSAITGVPRSKVLATGITDLWFDKVGWVLTFGIAYFIAPMPDWTLTAMSIMSGLILVIGASLLFFSRWKSDVKPGSVLARFREGLDHPNLGMLFFKQLWLSPLSWVVESLLLIFIAGAFHINLDFSQAFAVLTAYNISMVIPIPANAGTFEIAMSYALTAFGVRPEQAVAFSLVYHLMLLIPGVAAGAAIFGLKTGSFKFFRRVGSEV